jgi:hypothetical protein
MTVVTITTGFVVAIIVGLAFVLPCPACEKRRERMRAALARWRETHSGK